MEVIDRPETSRRVEVGLARVGLAVAAGALLLWARHVQLEWQKGFAASISVGIPLLFEQALILAAAGLASTLAIFLRLATRPFGWARAVGAAAVPAVFVVHVMFVLFGAQRNWHLPLWLLDERWFDTGGTWSVLAALIGVGVASGFVKPGGSDERTSTS